MNRLKQLPYAWIILAITWLSYLSMSSVNFGQNILYAYMVRDLNIPRDTLGLGISIISISGGVVGMTVGFLVNKVKLQWILFSGCVLLGISTLLRAVVPYSTTMFYFSCLIHGVALSLNGTIPMQAMITRWFNRNRSIATSVLLAAGGMGGMLSSAVSTYLIETLGYGWQRMWLVYAVAAFSISLPVLFLLRDRPTPEETAHEALPTNEQGELVSSVHRTRENFTLKEALKTGAVWLYLLSLTGWAFAFSLNNSHGILFLTDSGIASSIASTSVGVMSILTLITRLMVGKLTDRIEAKYLIGIGDLLVAASLIILLFTRSIVPTYLYAGMIGIGMGMAYVCGGLLLVNYYGPDLFPQLMSIFTPAIILAQTLPSYLGGWFKEQHGAYTPVFMFAIAFAALAGIAIFSAKPPTRGLTQTAAAAADIHVGE